MAESDVSRTLVDRGQRQDDRLPSGEGWETRDPTDGGGLAEVEEAEPVYEPPGRIIGGRYRIERPLAQGGMGSVYLATQLGLDRRVALKALLSNEPELMERFRREAVALADVSHPGVVEIYDFLEGSAETSGRCYLIMAFIDGVDLEAFVRSQPERRLSAQAVVELLLPVVSALVELHASGIIHRDLKPANLVRHLRADGRAFAKLVDFGIARREVDPGLTATGSVLGTPAYLAPEALFGRKQTPPSDVYSLGATLYELLTGSPPFGDGKPVEIIRRVMQHQLDLPADVAGTPLGDLVIRMLEMEPGKRPTAFEVFESFERLSLGSGEKPTPAQPSESPQPVPGLADEGSGMAAATGMEAAPRPRADRTDPVLGPLPPPEHVEAGRRDEARRLWRTPLVLGLVAALLVMAGALGVVTWQWRVAVQAARTGSPTPERSSAAPPPKATPDALGSREVAEAPRLVDGRPVVRSADAGAPVERAAAAPSKTDRASADPSREPSAPLADDAHGPTPEVLRQRCASRRDAERLYRRAQLIFKGSGGGLEEARRAFEALLGAACAPLPLQRNAAGYLVSLHVKRRDCDAAQAAQRQLETLARRTGRRPPRFPGCP